jgi:hypothetical protein
MRVLSALLLLAASAGAAPVEKGSPALVRQLVSAMAARQMDVIAVPDRAEPGRFIAAIVFPDVQLLVVSSRHESADAIMKQIASGQFRDVYIALNNGPAEGRILIHDMGCDGVREDGGEADIFYEGPEGRTVFDGNWAAQSLTEAAYLKKQDQADDRYSRALAVLLDAVRRIPADRR